MRRLQVCARWWCGGVVVWWCAFDFTCFIYLSRRVNCGPPHHHTTTPPPPADLQAAHLQVVGTDRVESNKIPYSNAISVEESLHCVFHCQCGGWLPPMPTKTTQAAVLIAIPPVAARRLSLTASALLDLSSKCRNTTSSTPCSQIPRLSSAPERQCC